MVDQTFLTPKIFTFDVKVFPLKGMKTVIDYDF